jgi:hypothetical protein
MRWLKKLLARLDAHADAEHGIDAPEDQVIRRLPRRIAFNAGTNEAHAQIAADLARAGELAEVRADIAEVEEQLRQMGSAGLRSLGVVVLLIAEFLAASLLLGGLGLVGIERLVLSAALTAGLVWLTGLVVEAIPLASRPPDAPPPRRFQFLVVLYTLLVTALAIARSATVEADVESTALSRGAYSVVLLTLTCGPAFLIKKWLSERRPAATLISRRTALKQRERELARRVARAEGVTARLAEEKERIDEAAEQLKAEYRHAHRLAAANLSLPAKRRKS